MKVLMSYANKFEVEHFLGSRGISSTCTQDEHDVIVDSPVDIHEILMEEGKKAWNDCECLRFDQCFIPASEMHNHPMRVLNGFFQARNHKIRNFLGPAF